MAEQEKKAFRGGGEDKKYDGSPVGLSVVDRAGRVGEVLGGDNASEVRHHVCL